MYMLALAALALFVPAFAQTLQILTPTPDQEIHNGLFTLQVAMPETLSPTESVSLVIGLQNCGSTPCPPADDNEVLGRILFAGNFNPQRVEPSMPPYTNYTFNASAIANPSSQHATLHLAQLLLLGAGPTPYLITRNVSVKFSL